MNDPVREYCRKKGYADHVILGGIRYLVESWEQVVQSIPNGETQYRYDYLNYLDGRQILDEVLKVASPNQKKRFSTRIEVADQQFLPLRARAKISSHFKRRCLLPGGVVKVRNRPAIPALSRLASQAPQRLKSVN